MAIQLAVSLDPKVWNKARTRLDRRLRYYRNELPYEAGMAFMSKVAEAIRYQQFPVAYKNLSAGYVKHKGHDNFWLYKDRVLTALMTTPLTQLANGEKYTAFTVNFSNDVQKIIDIMEYGTKKMPARPLFGPLMEEFKQEFMKETGTALADLARAFRGTR